MWNESNRVVIKPTTYAGAPRNRIYLRRADVGLKAVCQDLFQDLLATLLVQITDMSQTNCSHDTTN